MTTTPITYISQNDIIADFLRHRLIDPRRRAEYEFTESLTGDGSTKEFTLTPPGTGSKVSTIKSITIDGTSISKWKDYYFSPRENTLQLIFLDCYGSPANGSTINVTYKYGSTNWIYSDKPKSTLSKLSFPRVSVMTISSPGVRLGNYQAPMHHTMRFQIDVWTKDENAGTENVIPIVIGWNGTTARTRNMTGQVLAEYIATQVIQAFEDYENDLYPLFWGYVCEGGPRDLPFDTEYKTYRSEVDVLLNTLNLGVINQ